jgi:hypothetical protein
MPTSIGVRAVGQEGVVGHAALEEATVDKEGSELPGVVASTVTLLFAATRRKSNPDDS